MTRRIWLTAAAALVAFLMLGLGPATDTWASPQPAPNLAPAGMTGDAPFGCNVWTAIPSVSIGIYDDQLVSVAIAAPNDVWAVGDNGTIIHWDGATWKESVAAFQVNKKKPDLHGVWGSGPNDVWIVGDGVALHHTGANQ